MRIGLIGVGRMGKVLASKLAPHTELYLLDRDAGDAAAVAEEIGARTARDMEEIAALGTVILAVPDREVINCIKDFNQIKKPLTVVNIATNVAQHVLEETAAKHIACIGVKFVGHAGEMALGLKPVIVINERPAHLVDEIRAVFEPVGQVVVGRADVVTYINTVAVQKALEAAVHIEESLRRDGFCNDAVINSAIRQVAAGILKAYADQDLGPFAREIVRAVKAKMSQQGKG